MNIFSCVPFQPFGICISIYLKNIHANRKNNLMNQNIAIFTVQCHVIKLFPNGSSCLCIIRCLLNYFFFFMTSLFQITEVELYDYYNWCIYNYCHLKLVYALNNILNYLEGYPNLN